MKTKPKPPYESERTDTSYIVTYRGKTKEFPFMGSSLIAWNKVEEWMADLDESAETNLTEGVWDIAQKHPVLNAPALMSGRKVIAEFPDWRGDSFDEIPEKEMRANQRVIRQAKKNFMLLKQIESIYLDKKEKHGLNGFETGILASVQQQIKNSQ